jgi:hypothetical protein
MTIKEKIQKQIKRCEELLKMYEEIPTGFFGATMIRMAIKNAESCLMEGNYVESIAKKCLKDSEEIEG